MRASIAGLIAGRRGARRQKEAASQDIAATNQSNQVATAGQIEDFKKAFSACLEAKSYVVKF